MGIIYDMSDTWCRRFLNKLGMRWKVSSGSTAKTKPQDVIEDARRNLLEKLAYTMEMNQIPADRVLNRDQTSAKF